MRRTFVLFCAFTLTATFGYSAPLQASRFAFDSKSLLLDGKRDFLISGEFHYFRVPKAEWKRRLELFKAAGGNCIATYIPWIIHEEKEGEIVFGDRPERDLDGFLKLVEEEGLMAIVRPGPYQYSELVNNGLPKWLIEEHPEIILRNADGSKFCESAVDYCHPTFLAKVRPYFRAVAKVLRPHLDINGGCVVLTQLDNELTGVHVWLGYKPNEAYYAKCADYLETLRNYLKEDGIPGPYCHNAGGGEMCANYKLAMDRLGTKDFILGYDHYYGLFQGEMETPCPYYFFKSLFACDMLRGYGLPPVGFEIQAGTFGDVPPILKEDLFTSYMVNLAAGLRGINYYVFTGGPNYPGTGAEGEIYDYQAPIAADGTIRPTYDALKQFGAFLKAHPELLEAQRLTSVRMGLEWTHSAKLRPYDENFNRFGVFYALMQTDYSPEYYLLGGEIPLDGKPLILAGLGELSEEARARVEAYKAKGGKVLVTPGDEVLKTTWKQQHFRDAERVAARVAALGAQPVVRSSNRNVFTTAYRLKDGRTGVFALNLRTGIQKTTISIPSGASAEFNLPPMTVDYRILPIK